MKDSSDSKQWAPTIAKIAFLTLTAALVITVVYMVRMVLHAIILGTLFAIILMPLHRRLTGKVKQYLIYRRKSKSDENADEKAILSRSRLLSSFLMVFLVFFVIVIPVSAFAASVARQGVDAIPKAIRWIKNDMSSTAENFYEKNKKRLHLESIIKFTDDIIDNYFSEETYKPQEANGSVESELPPAERAYEGLEDSADGIDQSPAAAEATSNAPAIAGRSTANLSRFIGKIAVSCLNWLRKMIVAMLAETGIIIFNFFIMLFVMFHIFLDG